MLTVWLNPFDRGSNSQKKIAGDCKRTFLCMSKIFVLASCTCYILLAQLFVSSQIVKATQATQAKKAFVHWWLNTPTALKKLSLICNVKHATSYILCSKHRVEHPTKESICVQVAAGGKFTKGGRWPLKLESLSLFVDILVEFDRILITI